MQTPEIAPRPAPPSEDYAGSPSMIASRARQLLEEIQAGSVDAESFGANVTHALTAMGLSVPPMFAGMIGNAIRNAWAEQPA